MTPYELLEWMGLVLRRPGEREALRVTWARIFEIPANTAMCFPLLAAELARPGASIASACFDLPYARFDAPGQFGVRLLRVFYRGFTSAWDLLGLKMFSFTLDAAAVSGALHGYSMGVWGDDILSCRLRPTSPLDFERIAALHRRRPASSPVDSTSATSGDSAASTAALPPSPPTSTRRYHQQCAAPLGWFRLIAHTFGAHAVTGMLRYAFSLPFENTALIAKTALLVARSEPSHRLSSIAQIVQYTTDSLHIFPVILRQPSLVCDGRTATALLYHGYGVLVVQAGLSGVLLTLSSHFGPRIAESASKYVTTTILPLRRTPSLRRATRAVTRTLVTSTISLGVYCLLSPFTVVRHRTFFALLLGAPYPSVWGCIQQCWSDGSLCSTALYEWCLHVLNTIDVLSWSDRLVMWMRSWRRDANGELGRL